LDKILISILYSFVVVKIWPCQDHDKCPVARTWGSYHDPHYKSQPHKSNGNPHLQRRSHTPSLKIFLSPESKVIQPPETDSTLKQMSRHMVTLSITTNRSRQTFNREICYATLSSSSSKATLQVSRAVQNSNRFTSNSLILTTWIRSQQLQESKDSNRTIKDLHIS